MKKKEFSIDVGGKKLTAMFSDLAENASGSVTLTYGNTVVLATVVMSHKKREGIDFFPLVVDYEERFYAVGELLGSRFMRREGRPSDDAVLNGRIVDRTIRPLFDKRIRNEVQVIITILAIDEDDPDILAVNAASLALGTSNIPWDGPVSAVRIGANSGGTFFVNPTYKERENESAELDSIICGKDGIVNMIEVGSKEIQEDVMGGTLLRAQEEIKKLQEFQKNVIKEIGAEKEVMEHAEPSEELKALYKKHIVPELSACIFSPKDKNHVELKSEWIALVKEALPEESLGVAADYFEEKVDEALHKAALEEDKRADGRGMDEVRDLFAQAGGISPVLHGVGTFYRGGTHVLSVLTLGGPKDAQLIDNIENQEGEKRFMHHYNFPPFSGGETGRVGGMNRRMIGHGALAEKALLPVIPSKDAFPYTIRIVSESLASNGSTSMGSVCASTLALMDAGVPIKVPVAGIAMGLMLGDKPTEYKVLTDIQGPEDHHGDMDFKVAGTKNGITAVQMDVKVEGVPVPVLKEAFEKAKHARLHILETITKAIPEPRSELAPSSPRIIVKKIKEDQIGLVIGPSGQTIKGIVKETGAEVDINEDGTVYILGKNGTASEAEKMIEEIVHEFKPGERYDGEVTRIMDFGAFVKVGPHAEGLVHVSELAPVRIEKVTDVVKEGDHVPVVVKEVDEKGRLNLSVKKADPNFFKEKLASMPERSPSSPRRFPPRGNERNFNRR
jgi:polyribonucleotide nucleotidyltransferase